MKISQIHTEIDKKPKIFQFSKIVMGFFSNFLTHFVDWNIEKGQQGENVLSGMLREEIIAIFQMKNVWN